MCLQPQEDLLKEQSDKFAVRFACSCLQHPTQVRIEREHVPALHALRELASLFAHTLSDTPRDTHAKSLQARGCGRKAKEHNLARTAHTGDL